MENLKDKSILIIGMGRSGIASAEVLIKVGARVSVYDGKEESAMEPEILSFLKANEIPFYFGKEPEDIKKYQLLAVSPGVPLDIPIMQSAREAKIRIIGELELAYILGKGQYIAITGTNGKTTTTTLVGEIFTQAGKDTHVVGNIGTPVITKVLESRDETWLVTETSSFQLETVDKFKPKFSALLNLTPDHLNRHKTMENYGMAKAKIFSNQQKEDFFIVNYDDKASMEIAKSCKATIVPFSRKEELSLGAFIKDTELLIRDGGGAIHKICDTSKINILGNHNLENVLAAAAISFFAGVSADVIGNAIQNFSGVEHRLEIVNQIDGIRFINDSKGTNPDASIKAIEAMGKNVILIAGGYDKDSDFTEFINAFNGKVDYLILLGKTAPKIKETANRLGFYNVIMSKDMKECVDEAFRLAKKGTTVLLSPASASWDMYTCFEERGEDFKKCVENLKS